MLDRGSIWARSDTLVATVRGSIGQSLILQGVIDAGALADALARQSGRHPVASELYALGYASERQLCAALASQTGWPAIVFDESSIQLDVLEHVSLEWARIFNALVVYEDETTIIVAAARPEDAIVPARELGRARNKNVELRIALDITLARTIRVAFRLWKQGERYISGPEADRSKPEVASIHPDGDEDEHRRAQRALAEEAARNIENHADLPADHLNAVMSSEWQGTTNTTTSEADADPEDQTRVIAEELDRGADAAGYEGRPRALVVDPDPANRIQMVAELERLGYQCQAVGTGSHAVDLLAQIPFEFVFADIATPELDGLCLCRAVKRSRRLQRCRVVVTTAVVDSGQIADDIWQRAGADGYLEKPLDGRRLHRLLRDLSSEERADHEELLAGAIRRYHVGDIDGAIATLRDAIVTDPSSSRLHFMLANMLQRSARYAEAVDEYEAVVELQPAYFPALTRLAYLYFRQGLHARAVETWRRALPVCEDPVLRQNIELFMRKLVADMSKPESA